MQGTPTWRTSVAASAARTIPRSHPWPAGATAGCRSRPGPRAVWSSLASQQPADVLGERVGVLGRYPVREVLEELALLAPDVRLEQIREGGQCGDERVAGGGGDRVAPRLELAMIRDQGVQECETLRLVGEARAQKGEEGVLLGTKVDHEMIGEEGDGLGPTALRRARGGHGRHGAGRGRMMQTEGEAEGVAVVVRERDEARVAAASGHVVRSTRAILADEPRRCH